MKQLLIIPSVDALQEISKLAKDYSLGYEYNEFFVPSVLDDENKIDEIIRQYDSMDKPKYCTMHGAFFDVIPFSLDDKIKEVANLRIEQSIEIAKKIGASAVVFHTNFNPFLNSEEYIDKWIEVNKEYWTRVLEKYTDISIYLENMFDTTPDVIERLSKELCKYENYGVCLDYAHAALSKVNPEIWAEKLGKYVKHVHINDNDLVSDLHLAWGDGKINRAKFYECYEKYLKKATILIETNSYENIDKSLKVLKEEGFI